MSSKDKEKTFPERFKQFFRMGKGATGSLKSRVDFCLTPDIERDLRPDTALNHRIKTIKELTENVRLNRLEDNVMEKLWFTTKDLLGPENSKEHRHITFSFLRCLVQGQYEKLGMMRVHLFRLVKDHNIADDAVPRLELLQSLTENGRDILYFEEEIGPFLLQSMPAFTSIGKAQEFVSILVNIIKFNAAYIDEDIVTGLLLNVCYLCCWSSSSQEVLTCLTLLDTVVCYSKFPPESLPIFIGALCRTVNVEDYCASSWKVMRNLLGTHMGHSALFTMCKILQAPNSVCDVYMLRGAIFFIYMGLWGKNRALNLKYEPTAVLPSFLHALSCNHSLVMYEMMLSIQVLIKENGLSLLDPSWDLVLSIIEAIITHLETTQPNSHTTLVANHLHETICTVEQLIELGQFSGSVRRVFELIERCSSVRPETSVLRLINYLSNAIVPTRSEWLCKLNALVERYFRQETRTNIRVKVLGVLSTVIQKNRSIYEDELIERVVVPHLQHIDAETDITVRNSAAQLLVELCIDCENKRCLELLDILGKILNRPFEMHNLESTIVINSDSDVIDVHTVVMGLIRILKVKIYQLPSSHAIRTYKLLVGHLESHYFRPSVFENASSIRYMILECFLQLRANSSYNLGFPDSTTKQLRFSPFLCVDHKHGERPVSPPPVSPAPSSHPPCTVTYLSLTHACKAVITCLKHERDWKVLQLILQEVPKVMQNKALILSRHGNDIDLLAAAVCSIVSDKTLGLPDNLRGARVPRSEFQSLVIPVLASLASYHAQLEPALQQRTIKCLEYGLTSRCSRHCVIALATCMLEMRDAMHKLLPEVLLNLSKISATVHIAIPLLEFLSTLTRLPKVFGSFVGDQYMSVFAISLPYTNPFKYNHYTVSLAHHVIAVWFLKCRLPFRRDFVKFITTGLKANVLVPFEEGQLMKTDLVNEDSSNRKRSSSLTEHSSRRNVRPAATSAVNNRSADLKPPIDDALMNFHVELTETCIDLMARYTFSTCYAVPKRLPTADFLLSGGQSMTWLLGNKLITVTTSGCSQKALRNGLCDKCWLQCRQDKTTEPMSPNENGELENVGRRPKMTIQRSSSNEMPSSSSKEEIGTKLTRQMSVDPSRISTKSVNVNSLVEESKEQPEPAKLDQLVFGQGSKDNDKQERKFCACWCQGWAEIYVRRPTGDMSWVMRTQNQPHFHSSPQEFPIADITTLFLPSLATRSKDQEEDIHNAATRRTSCGNLSLTNDFGTVPFESNVEQKTELPSENMFSSSSSGPIDIPTLPHKTSPTRQESTESLDKAGSENFLEMEDAGKSRNPVRRSNSSPEMSASWKVPFLKESKQDRDGPSDLDSKGDGQKTPKQPFIKDPRVSCEAIPEEISGHGNTPPSNEGTHTLLSCHSYPGIISNFNSSQPQVKTVPVSPTTVSSNPSAGIHSSPLLISARPPPSPSQQSRYINIDPNKSLPKDSKSPSECRVPLTVDTSNKTIGSQGSGMSPQLPASGIDRVNKEEVIRPDTLPPLMRDRVHTISVMSPVRKPRLNWSTAAPRDNSPRSKDMARSGINPSFVFLQLYHAANFGSTNEKPILVPQTQVIQRAVKNLDRIPPYETHKIGVVYVGPGQAGKETDILANEFGSLRYTEFLQRLGTLICLKDADPQNIFLGGLDRNGNDGKFAYIWQDDVMQVIFHVATLMPTKENEPLCNSKKMHIGNDYVTIVYNESGEEYNIHTLKGQFTYACVVIQPLGHGTNQVSVKTREDLAEHIGHSESKIVSDQNLAILARQLALHANLASMISCSLNAKGRDPYASNWLERLRQIKRLRTKVLESVPVSDSDYEKIPTSPRSSRRVHMDDFTEYT